MMVIMFSIFVGTSQCAAGVHTEAHALVEKTSEKAHR